MRTYRDVLLACVLLAASCANAITPSLPTSAVRLANDPSGRSLATFKDRLPPDTKVLGRVVGKPVVELLASVPAVSACGLEASSISRVDVAVADTSLSCGVWGSLTTSEANCIVEHMGLRDLVIEPMNGGVLIRSELRSSPGAGSGAPTVLVREFEKIPLTESAMVAILPSTSEAPLLTARWNEKLSLEAKLNASAADGVMQWWSRALNRMPTELRDVVTVDRTPQGVVMRQELELNHGAAPFALALRKEVLESFKIPSAGMSPSLLTGDHVFVDKTQTTPRPGLAMVFRLPENQEHTFIKRVIGVEGDLLEVLDGRPILNGKLVPHCYVGVIPSDTMVPGDGVPLHMYMEFLGAQPYLTGYVEKPTEVTCQTDTDCPPGKGCRSGLCGVLKGPFKIAPDEAWVMGDNRDNSHDSRSWYGGRGGGVPNANWVGSVATIWISVHEGQVRWDRVFNSFPVPPMEGDVQSIQAALQRCLESHR